jgi:hypothetical protein
MPRYAKSYNAWLVFPIRRRRTCRWRAERIEERRSCRPTFPNEPAAGGDVLQILVGPALAELGAIKLDELASFRKCGGAPSAYDRLLLSHLAAAAE